MKKVFGIALGIVAAMGGFVDIGDLVFNSQVGARFGFQMLWVIPIGVFGIILFSEMCGRVAAVSGRPVFDVVRERFGYRFGLLALVASGFLTFLTLCAELGGMAAILKLATGGPLMILVLASAAFSIGVIWLAKFTSLERIFGYLGMFLCVFIAAAIAAKPDWGEFAKGFQPSLHHGKDSAVYLYYVVGLLAAAMTPYEVYFYSSGGVEERWTPKDLGMNRLNAIVGYGLGGLLSIAIIATTAQTLHPIGIDPETIGSVALSAQLPLGQWALWAAMLGMFFAIGGATVDAGLSGAYNSAQFFGWDWGRYKKPRSVPRFTFAWLAFFGLATLIALSGIDPIKLTEYSVVLGVVALPFTYLPILLVARDPTYMGENANGRFSHVAGWAFFALIMVVAVAAIPLMLITNLGIG
jgi:Mn2+/Fe2+ NRAMP family transporter